MSTWEEELTNRMAQEMADVIDAEILIKEVYKDYKKVYGPRSWLYTNIEIKQWCLETLPNCFYFQNTLYYEDEADAIMFRLKWI